MNISRYAFRCGALMIVSVFAASGARADGPGIYDHTIARTHSSGACLQRAMAVANAHNWRVEGSEIGMWMTGSAINYSHSIRCDIPGKTLFITSGPSSIIRQRNADLRFEYATIQLGQ